MASLLLGRKPYRLVFEIWSHRWESVLGYFAWLAAPDGVLLLVPLTGASFVVFGYFTL